MITLKNDKNILNETETKNLKTLSSEINEIMEFIDSSFDKIEKEISDENKRNIIRE
jgi:hypothetical protein